MCASMSRELASKAARRDAARDGSAGTPPWRAAHSSYAGGGEEEEEDGTVAADEIEQALDAAAAAATRRREKEGIFVSRWIVWGGGCGVSERAGTDRGRNGVRCA